MTSTFFTPLKEAITRLFSKQPSRKEHGVPRHVAIIMDGNRRWAKKRGVPVKVGHWQGADTLDKLTEFASDIGVEVLTVYSFSTENWSRPRDEVSSLMELFSAYLKKMRKKMIREGVRLSHIGDIKHLPEKLRELLLQVEADTAHGKKITLVLALNYGSRNEMTRAVQEIARDVEEGTLSSDEINEELIASKLDTATIGDPDLLIRTSGEMRLSNFLLWQLSYTELYITEQLWPDFSREDFLEAITTYRKREIRRGG